MKLSKKHSICLALSLVALSLASCTNGESGSQDAGTTELDIAFAECGFGKEYLEKWGEAYNLANPDAKIKLVLDGDPQMTASMLPRLQAGKNLPDIFLVLSTNWQASAVKGYFEPLDDVYAAEAPGSEGKTVKDYMVDGMQEFGKVNDHYYAMPWSIGPTGIVYNVTMFQQYNWKVPTTFEELVALCAQIKTDSGNTIAPFAWSGQAAAYWDFLCENWWGEVEGEANWKTFWEFGSPEVFNQAGRLACLQGFYDLICDGGKPKNSIEGASSKTFMQAQISFINSESAMIPNGTWLENEVKSTLPEGFKMALMETPHVSGAKKDSSGNVIKTNVNSAGDFMVVPVKAAHKDVAKKFLTFISGKEANESFTKNAGGFRPFKYSVSSLEGISDFTKSCAAIFDNSTNLFKVSNNSMYYLNLVNDWPGYGSPYARMIQDDDKPADVMSNIHTYVADHWTSFQAAAGASN
jgi:N-acetylglucosamine transport system substrate-binding protein